ncbi:hypothetical protein CDD83_10683 [Cordyceps sp. RAO-2017]|nr:hypothetical protein CDD83_10683 [Cordyceps sp. RAO-2017]
MAPSPRLLLPLALLLLLLLSSALVDAQQPPAVRIYNESRRYAYHGCYNETTEVEGSARARALADGFNDVRQGDMTVPLCLGLCGNAATPYRYAGLEWSRECWCSQTLAGIARRLDDAQCRFPCEGDRTTACGGSLKLSVYRLTAGSARLGASALVASLGLALAFLS